MLTIKVSGIISQADYVCQLYCINKTDMNNILELPETAEKIADADLSRLQMDEPADSGSFMFLNTDLKPARAKRSYFKFYVVYKNETAVITASANNLKTFEPTLIKIKANCAKHSLLKPAFFLPADNQMFYAFLSPIRAMEHAKARALKYINKLIDEGENSLNTLLKYREDHYLDLNINLTDRNIKKLERSQQVL